MTATKTLVLAALAALLTVAPVTAEAPVSAGDDGPDDGSFPTAQESGPCPVFEYWLKPQVGYRLRPECLPVP